MVSLFPLRKEATLKEKLYAGLGDLRPVMKIYRDDLTKQVEAVKDPIDRRTMLLSLLEQYRRIAIKLAGAGTNYERLLLPPAVAIDQLDMLTELVMLGWHFSMTLNFQWMVAVSYGLPVDEGLVTGGLIEDAPLPDMA